MWLERFDKVQYMLISGFVFRAGQLLSKNSNACTPVFLAGELLFYFCKISKIKKFLEIDYPRSKLRSIKPISWHFVPPEFQKTENLIR